MIPDEVALTGYRSFEHRQAFALKPLTLFYGRNNAGKSALLRALPLLSDSIATYGSDVLSLSSPAMRGGGFRDLSFDGRPEGFTIELMWTATRRRVRVDFRLFPDWNRTVIQRFEVLDDASSTPEVPTVLFALVWTPRREERESPKLTYHVEVGQQVVGSAPVNFRGPVPQLEGEFGTHPELVASAAALRAFGGSVQWLEAARKRPERTLPEPLGPRWRIEPNGGDAVVALRSLRSIERAVSAWFERRVNRRVVTSDAGPGTFFVAAEVLKGDRHPHSISDLGEGMTQVLPVLTALELARRHRDGGPSVLAIEEPESNLHPRLQSELAMDFCALAAEKDPPRVVIETHSEHFFTGLQLAVLNEPSLRDHVAVYWVRQDDEGVSRATHVEFDDQMRVVEGWPEGAFDEAVELAERVIEARRRRAR